MPTRPNEALLDEAADWIAQQLSEEGLIVTGGLVGLVLSTEWDALEAGAPADQREALVQTICGRLEQEGVKVGPIPTLLSTEGVAGGPKPVPPEIVAHVLSWEDEFLGLAGRSRDG